jgi:hypothetical protein
MAERTSAASRIGASETHQTPSGNVSATSAAAWIASRVLPVPPGYRRRHDHEHDNATEKWRRRDRQVRLIQALQRWEVAVPELVDALWRRKVLQPVLAEVAKTAGVDERRGGGGDEHLPAMAAGRDSRRSVHVDADVALLCQVGGAGVDAHPHPDRTRCESFQCLGGRL